MNSGKQIFPEERLDAWYDGSSICVIAVSTHGDPLDLSENEARAFVQKLQACLKHAEDEGSPLRRLRQFPRNHLSKILLCRPQREE